MNAELVQISSVVEAGVRKLKEIVAGWWYLLFPNQAVERLASQRSEVCARCPHNTGTKCGKCGCPLMAKIRSPGSSCPDGRWVG